MIRIKLLLPLLILFVLTSCDPSKKAGGNTSKKDDGKIELIFLQMNDVYEISPLEGGKTGGLARVATVKKELQKENPNVITILAGDFLNPSAIGTIKQDGKRIKGAHMVDVLNSLGLNIAIFGNHEFDLKENELQERINESKFMWVASNVGKEGGPFTRDLYGKEKPIPKTLIIDQVDADGTAIKVGVMALTLENPNPKYERYENVEETAIATLAELKGQCNFVVAITHQDVADDIRLAKKIPEVPLLMGGHDHHNMLEKVGNNNLVAKADANAKSVYIHRIQLDLNSGIMNINSELKQITDAIPEDPEVAATVKKWEDIAFTNLKAAGFEPSRVIAQVAKPLEGREAFVRHQSTNLGSMVARSYSHVYPESDCAFVNSGSIRIDDQISGTLTEFDVVRILPFGGKVLLVEMTGELLEKTLNAGLAKKGKGAYLQWDKLMYNTNTKYWLVNGKKLDKSKVYKVAVNDFLLTGYDIDFFKEDNPGIKKVMKPEDSDQGPKSDVRKALISYLTSGRY